MTTASKPSLARRLSRIAVGSLLAWCAAVGGVWWYLDRAAAPEYRMGARSITDAASYGLALVGFAIWLGIALVVLDVVVAIVLLWRRRNASERAATGPAA